MFVLQSYTVLRTRRHLWSYANISFFFAAVGTIEVVSASIQRFSPSHLFVQRPSLVRFPSTSYVKTSGVFGMNRFPVMLVVISAFVPFWRTARFVTAKYTWLLLLV